MIGTMYKQTIFNQTITILGKTYKVFTNKKIAADFTGYAVQLSNERREQGIYSEQTLAAVPDGLVRKDVLDAFVRLAIADGWRKSDEIYPITDYASSDVRGDDLMLYLDIYFEK